MTDIFCSEYFVLTGFAPIHNDLDNKMIGFWHPSPRVNDALSVCALWNFYCSHVHVWIRKIFGPEWCGYEKYLARRRRCASLESPWIHQGIEQDAMIPV